MMVYSIDVFGFKAKGESRAVFLLIPVALLIGYLAGCLVLFSFTELIGLLEFTWINGFYTIVLMGAAKSIFTNSNNN